MAAIYAPAHVYAAEDIRFLFAGKDIAAPGDADVVSIPLSAACKLKLDLTPYGTHWVAQVKRLLRRLDYPGGRKERSAVRRLRKLGAIGMGSVLR
jgi:hypothetical protein